MPRTAIRATTMGLYKKMPKRHFYDELSSACADPTDIPYFVVLITDCVLKKKNAQYVTKSLSYIAITKDVSSSIQIANLSEQDSPVTSKALPKDDGGGIQWVNIIAESGHQACAQLFTSKDSIYYWNVHDNTNPVIAAKVMDAITEFCDGEEEEEDDL